MSILFSSTESLRGTGKVKAEKYHKLGIDSVYDLICHFPKKYLDFHCNVSVQNATIDEYNCLKLRIKSKFPPHITGNNLILCKAIATDGTEDITVTIFNNIGAFQYLRIGYEYYMYGKVTYNVMYGKEISAPTYIHVSEKNFIKPQYRLTQGLTVNVVRSDVRQALDIMHNEPFETLSGNIRRKYSLKSLMWSLENIHFPDSMKSAEQAKKRLAFDELLRLQLGMLIMRKRSEKHTSFKMKKSTYINSFIKSLPFELTEDQKKASADIISDLCRDVPMNRLLQGDVGSGKTAVAAIACYFTAKNGIQSALMAPTEILASQHYKTLSGLLEPFGVRVCLLTGSMTAKKKAQIRAEISAGGYDVIVGTHAIIQKDVEYKSLGLVITDEQHRFGVSQRSALAEKGDMPHKLVMSATPIPRTLALMIYGDLDISVIAQLPKGRKPVVTYTINGKIRQRAFGYVRKFLEKGEQVYIVCPTIEDNDNDLLSVESYAEKFVKSEFQGYNMEILHGRMSPQEKDSVMERFHEGKTDILICTTVVEVGVDVPNASVMIIENAERFGMSQIHQLRGRVGRGQSESICILITDNTSAECLHRMKVMRTTSDGFAISEEDLKMRGPGDFFGNAQHGLPPMKIADLSCDMQLMNNARQCAMEIIADDPLLEQPCNNSLKMEVIRLFDKDIIG